MGRLFSTCCFRASRPRRRLDRAEVRQPASSMVALGEEVWARRAASGRDVRHERGPVE